MRDFAHNTIELPHSVRIFPLTALNFQVSLRIFVHSCVKIETFGKKCAHSAVELLEGSKNFCTQLC